MSTSAFPASNPRVGFVSLGCPKALVDSERILPQLRVEGYDIVQTYDDADVVVVNTCGFIDSAVTESLAANGEAIDRKSGVEGKSVSGRVYLGGRRVSKKKKMQRKGDGTMET